MKVIIFEEDKVVSVADGYARNYLLPRKLAALVTPSALKQLEKRKKKREEEAAQKKSAAEELRKKMRELTVTITREVGEEGRLFGSVTSQDIAQAILEQSGIDIDRKKIELEDPLKVVGVYQVPVKLFPEVEALLKVDVISQR